tara:strand:+ start:4620 stop:5438 length:819 start_codon:yes stop_codon:yes gene_type:complete
MKKISTPFLFMLIASFFTACTGQHSEKSESLSALEKQVEQQKDIHTIQQLMSKRAYYHSAGRNDLEFELYATRNDISWGQNQGFMVGQESVKAYYVDANISTRKKQLEQLSKVFPELANEEKNLGAGTFVFHSTTTPIIEVAEDGETAKGVWYTPGALAMTDNAGNFNGLWLWERYAVDFIKENGEWKFWHILVLTDFMTGMGQNLNPTPTEAPIGSEGNQEEEEAAMPIAHWDIEVENYTSWSPTTVQGIAPQLPQPYATFSETFSYGPPQ